MHARKILAAHHLGGLRSEKQILSLLQSDSVSSVDSNSSDDDAFAGFLKKLATGGKPTSPRQSTARSSTSDDSVDEKTEICGFNLRGKCSYGNKCNALHTSEYCISKRLIFVFFSIGPVHE
jgi:hypothetical protein